MKNVNNEPMYELINPSGSESILYVEHGYPHQSVVWHLHKEYELHLITHSSGKVLVGDYIGNFYPGNLILTGPNLPHNWITEAHEGEVYPERDKVIVFSDDLLTNAANVFPEILSINTLLEKASYGIHFHNEAEVAFYIKIIEEISVSHGIKRLYEFLKLLDMLSKTENYTLLSSVNSSFFMGDRNAGKINVVVNYIFENYNKVITRDELAELIGLEATYFSRYFQKSTGQTISGFVNAMRISKACDLILRSDMKITDICFSVGFSNISHFNRCFIKQKDCTPSTYKKKLMKTGVHF
ncbi:AraC family transcriptional regulator [Marinomonas primoryensis]|jgi:AraC-like DNA-binding protein|uniref:AraC family transcriptional regulator n=1 Tax=Marinomonas primoryensis TaxID=178399 RepID=UPI0030DB78F7|tara:strand:- start:285 stop:1175 length:891 start_codon:yes stop_codon:yes gene_type:complete